MKEFILTEAARADLKHIWRYSAKNWSRDQAERYTDAILDTCQNLASGRKHGRRVTEHSNYMRCTVGTHVIYYRVEGTAIIIVRILHGMMDADKHLN